MLFGCRSQDSTGAAPISSSAHATPSAAAPSAAAAPDASSTPKDDRLDCSDGRIAFVSDEAGNRDVYSFCPDGSALMRLTENEGDDHVAAVARDGTLALLTLRGAAGEPGYSEQLARLDRGKLEPFGPRRPRMRNPSWLPDGRSMIVESDLAGFSDLFRLDPDGKLTALTHDEAGSFEPAVSPDGRTIAFVSSRGGDADIYTMKTDGSEVLRLTRSRGDDVSPAWSPDGKQIAFLSSRRGPVRVHVMNADGSKPRALDDDGDIIGESELAWSPDGSAIVYVQVRRDGATVRIVDGSDGRLIARRGGAVRDETPAWSPDGSHLAFASSEQGRAADLYRMKRDGTGVARLTQSSATEFLPRWLPAAKN